MRVWGNHPDVLLRVMLCQQALRLRCGCSCKCQQHSLGINTWQKSFINELLGTFTVALFIQAFFFYPEMTDILRFMDWTFNCRRLHRAPSGCIASSAVLWFILIHILSSGIFLCMLIFYFISACYNFLLGKNSQFSANEAQIECDTALCKNSALSDSTEDLCRVHS